MNLDIAVVGMDCAVPGAKNLDAFWDLLITGREGLRTLTAEEIAALNLENDEDYVAAGGFIDDIDLFDAEKFGYTAKEACCMDPQQRLFLQSCWRLLESTNNINDRENNVAVFASEGHNTYFSNVILKQHLSPAEQQSTLLGNVSDCLATRVSYALNLSGPSLTLQCGCSSSMVAIHYARMALLARQCDAAIAGGVAIHVPQIEGYYASKESFASMDGHCRPFSDDADGTVFSNGYGVVLLKRLDDALSSGDTIYAVIKGSAINNDGSNKASFTAPGLKGQVSVLEKAWRVAKLKTFDEIGYLETHGTGTAIGDPIELTALTEAIRNFGGQSSNQPLSIGSVKANIGHLDVAAGIVSFIKASLILYHKKMTPQINFRAKNPKIKEGLNYKITTEPSVWQINKASNAIRKAAVSAFGFGGTNAHIVLEESPQKQSEQQDISEHYKFETLIFLSAENEKRLHLWIDHLHDFLKDNQQLSLPSVAKSLQVGRRQQACRVVLKVASIQDLIQQLARLMPVDFVQCKLVYSDADLSLLSLEQVMKRWLSGEVMHWKNYFSSEGVNIPKAQLPAPPLMQESYWLEETYKKSDSVFVKTKNIDDWFFTSNWKQVVLEEEKEDISIDGQVAIINLDNTDSALGLCKHIPSLTINEIQANTQKLIYFLPENMQQEDYCNVMHSVFDKLLFYLKNETLMKQLEKFTLVMKNVLPFGSSNLKNGCFQTLVGLVRSLGQEYPSINIQIIDIDHGETSAVATRQILQTIKHNNLLDVVAWRNNLCWALNFDSFPNKESSIERLCHAGVYVVTGGLGDVGSVYVEFLAKQYNARVIILGRTALPCTTDEMKKVRECASSSAATKKKIDRLLRWSDKQYHVNYYQVDVADTEAMTNVFEKIIDWYQQIDGLIHVAGAASDMHYKLSKELDWAHCWALFEPKIIGFNNLNALKDKYHIALGCVVSSISSALAGVGLGAYAASHHLLDWCALSHRDWLVMNWDAWNFHMQKSSHVETDYGDFGSGINELAITAEEGQVVLDKAFCKLGNWRQLFISTTPLQFRFNYWAKKGFCQQNNKVQIKHTRPHLNTEYIQPNTVMQKKLVATWEDMLGIAGVGVMDNFFELGGHSLLALELVNKLKNDYNFSCSVVELFSAPTIMQLAQKIELTREKIVNTGDESVRVQKQRSSYAKWKQIRKTEEVE